MHQHTDRADGLVLDGLSLLDHGRLDWRRIGRTTFLVHQQLRYDYPGPIADLRQQLIVVPPERLGDQRRIMHRLEVSTPGAVVQERADQFGNHVISVAVPRVVDSITFEAWVVVERCPNCPLDLLPADAVTDRRLLSHTKRTTPDERLRDAAATAVATGRTGLDLADDLCSWTRGALSYAHDVTSVATSAAQALAVGSGVCQDYAHIMITLCRLAGLPARYVSGHLLGEGGSHAWLEVLVPGPGGTVAVGYDPTHDRRVGRSYVSIAVGRDYGDVAPTSGTYNASISGRLHTSKRAGITAVDLLPDGEWSESA